VAGPRRLLVLLLPTRLEAFALREHAEELLRSPAVVALEPGRIGTGGLPSPIADGLAHTQARRLRLPGEPAVLVIHDPRQYPLARALMARNPGVELWYGIDHPAVPAAGRRARRMAERHVMATERAALTFQAAEDMATLLDRFAALGTSTVEN
jgi:hypothetical protein